MNAQVCATVTGKTTEELRANRDTVNDADLVEVRLDYAENPDVAGILADRHRPVIVTCRPQWEGGRFQGSEEERRRLLAKALELGAEYVDIEWHAGFFDLVNAENGRRIILSTHDFDCIPEDIDERFRQMRSSGAEVVKVAVRVNRLSELVVLRDFSRRSMGRGNHSQIVIGMGPAGVTSRVLPDQFGSCWTYAGLDVAPGQIGLSQMLREFRVRSMTATAELFGVLGSPLEHSLSPVMHNAGFDEIGRDAVYLPFEAADFNDFEEFAKEFNVRGVSVTAPFKEEAISKISRPDELSRRVGAVNTLRMDRIGWRGINTDVSGFLSPLKGRISLDGCRASVIGSGGAARAVAIALSDKGARVTICARNSLRARSAAALVSGTISGIPPAAGTWDLLVNTTPIGTYPRVDATPMLDAEFSGNLVYDLVYNPPVTRLLAEASQAGCGTIGGLDMLVAQAERQFKWWIGSSPGGSTFRHAAKRRLTEVKRQQSADR